ncbi:hypothetical protein [Citrobacter freundii]|uniref:hypothetical protein n=2 Tax=Citrobacter TaxID=544 RepID=UPI002FE53DCE
MQKQTFSAKALGNEYATGVSRPAVLTTKAFLPHQRVTTEGKAMATYFERNVICTKDGGDGFQVGNVYELLEIDGVYCVENDENKPIEAFRGNQHCTAGNSNFDNWNQ